MIAQADSRKWMACLYNSFLFMEAKIMKMAKKLLALVLTGVMAMSMLTGCALSDKVKAEALEKALNSDAAQGTTVDVTYKYNDDLNGKASTIWTGATADQMLNKTVTAAQAAATTLTTVTIGGKDYGYIVLTAPEKKDAKDKLEWVTAAKKFDGAVANKQISATTAGQVKNYAATGADPANKVKFGVKFVDNGEKGDKKVDYAIVVVEINK